MKFRALIDWLVPIGILVALTIVFRMTELDLRAAAAFYEANGGWVFANDQPWDFLYRYGVIPSWIVSVSALVFFVLSFWRSRFARRRIAALYLVLVMIIGPGLLVNEVFKKRWGRPRPIDITEFGGPREFLPVWERGPIGRGNSFASGHASTGFYMLVPFFLLRRRSPGLAAACLVFGLAYGSLMGLGRMAQGKHFLSDVVWAWGFVHLTALALYYTLPLRREGDAPAVLQ